MQANIIKGQYFSDTSDWLKNKEIPKNYNIVKITVSKNYVILKQK